jgi:ABC-type transport system involved in multi-copper enzyme maturation permease subunit
MSAAAQTRDVSRPVPFATAFRGIFELSLEAMLWSRRTLFMAVLVGLPAVIALIYRIVLATGRVPPASPHDTLGYMIVTYEIGNALPLAALFYATALISDEVEGKTITYLLSRPIRREAILAGKFAAYLATTLSLALPAAVVIFFLLATTSGWRGVSLSVADLARDLGVIALTLVAYGALYTLMGVLLRRPLVPGLLFAYGWEWLYKLPGSLPRYTLTAYLRSLVSHRVAEEGLEGLFLQVLPVGTSLGVVVGASAVFLAAAFWIFSQREYVLPQ